MRNLIITIFLILISIDVRSQNNLFSEISLNDVGEMSREESIKYNNYKNNRLVSETAFIKLNIQTLSEDRLAINFHNISTSAQKTHREQHNVGKGDFSWFGRLSDETGIFFTVINNQVASKFYLKEKPCLIIPFRGDIHLLIIYNGSIDEGACGTPHQKSSREIFKSEKLYKQYQERENTFDDNNCNMRVLWVVTGQAEPEIPMTLELAARMLQDESNLAYEQSQINYRMEIARVVRTNYTETTDETDATAYGKTFAYPSDLINLSEGTGALSNIPTLRNLYAADVVVMVRSQATNNEQGFFGIAYGVPTDDNTLNEVNAFALISTEFMIGGRFTFAHEIGHIQGARHDKHNAGPTYARGYVFSNGNNNNRTIMAVGGNCNPPTGCRVQFFSNPNVTFNNIPVGISGERDNARRINETSNQILNHRITSENLLLETETYDDGILAHHLANETISTNGKNILALSGSRVSMRAGSNVKLLTGFRAMSGSNFRAYIQTCSNLPNVVNMIYNNDIQTNDLINELSEKVEIYPNPFSNTFTVKLELDASSEVTFTLSDASGTVRKKVNKRLGGGRVQFELNTSDLPSGLYFYRLEAGGKQYEGKVLKQK